MKQKDSDPLTGTSSVTLLYHHCIPYLNMIWLNKATLE
jgi:hypothetical protein